jgi:DNA repair photolyase
MSLKNIDFWYWSRYYVDLYRVCPYGCSYCNTQAEIPMSGFHFLPGLPKEPHGIGLGLLSDPYHPESERNAALANILEMLYVMKYPVNILTKSDRVIEHLDILNKLSQKDLVRVTFTILTSDDILAAKIEGSAPSPANRLEALKVLIKENIPSGVAITPIIPFVTDDEESLSHLVRLVKQYGARWVLFSGFDHSGIPKDLSSLKKFFNNAEDEQKLESRYRKVKRFMLGLLHQERLPIRIPRITLKRFTNRYFTNLVSECLFNISYLYELLDRELEMTRYRRVACDIEDMNASLKSLVSKSKLGHLKGVNPEIESVIREVLFKGTSEFYESLYSKVASEV